MHAGLTTHQLKIRKLQRRLRRMKQQILFLIVALSIANAYEIAMLFHHAWIASAIGASIIIGSLLYVAERIGDLGDVEQQLQDLLDDVSQSGTESNQSSVTSSGRYLRPR